MVLNLQPLIGFRNKAAFAPAPAVEQAVMAQAQGQGPPPGQDPAAAQGGGGPPPGAPPGAGPGGPPPGAPPGMPPGQPGQDPAAAQGGPPPGGDPGAAAGGPDPSIQAMIQQEIQKAMAQQQQMMGGAGAGSGKPGGSMKFEPHHMQQLLHTVTAQNALLRGIAEKMGLEIPATALIDSQPPLAMPGQPPQAPPQPGAAGPPPSQVAQQLPSLPPAAAKAASAGVLDLSRLRRKGPVRQPVDTAKLASARLDRLDTGRVVAVHPDDAPLRRISAAKLASVLGGRRR